MSLLEFVLLVVAGFLSGVIGFVTGLASLVSYPALLAVGVPPVAANVTNTVALVAVGIGSTANSAGELFSRGRQLAWWCVLAGIGGGVGALILLTAPAESFEAAVPFLVLIAAAALLAQPRLRALVGRANLPLLLPIGILVIAVYGGYFGAGAGVMFIALFLIATSEGIWQATVVKSLLLGIANLVAAIGFAVFGPVDWLATLALAIGMLAGGWCGPPVVKVLPPNLLRIGVAIAAIGLAVWLFIG
ncbi:sulfite exporter TauE/SafE family protein [Aldersonia sp. NBC_00410]|uniref:sulfite exporter TauE/SafE family protein n=1 Tax=Aldersonia sp. NBC_00410 TaxID=2975954 RepID=UPI0022541914|nr:sulfite exporter TauE/SafE family protein [Aldersonia sp. NBC_00410]MCX5043655.1 sulfite exporter TauE/SafE family protein [Aldersonia sp. NBC_00410]